MKIKIPKGTEDVHPYTTHIIETIREKLRPLRYSEKLKHYTDELQYDVIIKFNVNVKRKKNE